MTCNFIKKETSHQVTDPFMEKNSFPGLCNIPNYIIFFETFFHCVITFQRTAYQNFPVTFSISKLHIHRWQISLICHYKASETSYMTTANAERQLCEILATSISSKLCTFPFLM